MADAKKAPRYLAKGNTPAGKLVFPHLTKPDTKFKAEGEFRTRFTLDGADAQALIAKLDPVYETAIDKMADEQVEKTKKSKAAVLKTLKRADKPYKPVLDDDGNETGAYVFTFKQRAEVKLKDGTVIKKKVDLFDAAKRPIASGVAIYGGSVAKIAYEALPFYTPAVGAGLTLRLCAVQVLELRTAGERDADSYGFDEEGEGLDAPESSSTEGSTEGTAEAGADATDF